MWVVYNSGYVKNCFQSQAKIYLDVKCANAFISFTQLLTQNDAY